MSATHTAIQNKFFGSDDDTLIISKEEMDDIMKRVKFLDDASLLIISRGETIKNKAKEQKGGFLSTLLGTLCDSLGGFLSMLLGRLGASLLGNLLTGKGVKQTRSLDRIAKACN